MHVTVEPRIGHSGTIYVREIVKCYKSEIFIDSQLVNIYQYITAHIQQTTGKDNETWSHKLSKIFVSYSLAYKHLNQIKRLPVWGNMKMTQKSEVKYLENKVQTSIRPFYLSKPNYHVRYLCILLNMCHINLGNLFKSLHFTSPASLYVLRYAST